jgi:integrase/recombinase XerD
MNELCTGFANARLEYLQYCQRRGYSRSTLHSYGDALEHFFGWLGQQYAGLRDPREITREMVTAYQMCLYQMTSRFGKRLSVNTQYNWMGAILWFLRWSAQQEKILINPGASIQLPRRPKRIPSNYLSLKEMQKLLRAPDLSTHTGLRNRAILEVLYSTGMRSGELRALKLEDLNLQDGWITVRAGKGAKDRVVPIGKAAMHFTTTYLEKTRPKLIHDKKHSIIFVSQYGTPLGYESLNQIVQKTAKTAGIKRKVTPHALRHTCATLMLRGKADIRHIQELLGHSSLSSTQIYTRVEIGDLKKVHAKCHPREREPLDQK